MATLKDVAQRAQVSIVTVHKCIYGKPGVSQDTRRRVLALAAETHYAPGPAGRARRKGLRLAVVLPRLPDGQNSFFASLEAGVQRAREELSALGVTAVLHRCGPDWQSQSRLLENLAEAKGLEAVQGAAVCCVDDRRLNGAIGRLAAKNIPVVTFNADAPDSMRLAYVSPPAEKLGALAAELLCKLEPSHRRLLIAGGDKRLSNLQQCTAGFYSYIQQNRPDISLVEINNADHLDLEAEIVKLFHSLDDITGVYCAMTRNDLTVCRVLQRLGLQGRVRLVCTDVFPELRPFLLDGTADATLWQDPQAQGYNGAMALYHYLQCGKFKEADFSLRVCPVLRSNFDDFL